MKHINENGDIYFPIFGSLLILGFFILAIFLSACNNDYDKIKRIEEHNMKVAYCLLGGAIIISEIPVLKDDEKILKFQNLKTVCEEKITKIEQKLND